ncbi:TonB-dependent receptor [Algoriphagus taiwanensis]|uniref:TonB-dependent receptor plug domain-containing protein n=1 Tax=Algoriphagus taiwanensis TaxID=1445656 RepID=A0ABQ6Q4G0_9BACT|nr:hypothetical protein Ataiwa_32410 [Algoriphagus taiwanensis]
MKKHFSLIALLFLFCLNGMAQTGTITGIVKDAETGETLPFCNVFINNTTISTVTDMDGSYTLSNLEPGPVELGFSFLGYESQSKTVTLSPGGKLTVNLNMKPFAQELTDVEIQAKRDKAWERDLRKFQNLFIGIDEAASRTQILNPWVVDFPAPEERNSFVAKAELPLEIQNNYLGYKITFDLREFFDSPTQSRISGSARFEELTPESESQRTTWEKNRADVYRKSPMNMFRSLLNGTAEREGFYLYGDKPGGSESMNMRSDIFANELGKSVVPYKADPLVTPTSPPGTYLINLKGRIEVHYQKGYAQANTYRDAPYPVSWLEVSGGQVKVRENGMVLNAQDLVFSGDMDRKRISNLLPLDYNAEKAIQLQDLAKTAKNYQEKVYIHTDKAYYYAGDQVYFQGYFAYGNPYLRDELSKVLHVELISSDRDLVIEKKFPVRDGVVTGDFYLPDTLRGEQYFLRAYTNWNKNYGPGHYFLQPLAVLSPFARVSPQSAQKAFKNQGVALKTSKDQGLGAREKVNLTISTQGPKGQTIPARISVAVTDASAVLPIPRQPDMNQTLNLEGVPEGMSLDRFSYPVEKSLVQEGIVRDAKGKGSSAQVTGFVNDFQGMIDLEANKDGIFRLEEMEFYGPMKLAFSATDNKGKPLKDIELQEQLKAPVALPADPFFPKTTQTDQPIRPIADEEENVEELEEILVEDKAVQEKQAIYGKPDYVVTGDQLTKTGNSSDLVASLAGNVPGMRVTLVGATGQQQIRLRGGSATVTGSAEPVVMLNGSIMVSTGTSTASDNLRSINPFDIDRVEVVTRISSMLGDQGRNGVIAVYLKENGNSALPFAGEGIKEFVIEGYQPPSNFFPVDYSTENDTAIPDFRQTLYWNPFLVTEESGKVDISFFTNDRPGPVLIEVRGMGADGEILFGTFLINQQ